MRTYCFPLDLEDYYVGLSKFGMLKSALRWFDRDLGFVLVCYWHRDCWGNRLTIDLIVDGIAVVFIAAIKRTIGYAIAAHAQRNAWTVLTAEHARGADDAQWHCRCGRASRGACCSARCCCCRCCCLSCRSSTTGYIWMTLCGKIEYVYTMMIKRVCCECVFWLSVPAWLWLLTAIGLIGAVLAVGLSIATHCGIHALAVATAELVHLARARTVRLIGSILAIGIAVALSIFVHTVSVAAAELITGAACTGSIKGNSISNRSG